MDAGAEDEDSEAGAEASTTTFVASAAAADDDDYDDDDDDDVAAAACCCHSVRVIKCTPCKFRHGRNCWVLSSVFTLQHSQAVVAEGTLGDIRDQGTKGTVDCDGRQPSCDEGVPACSCSARAPERIRAAMPLSSSAAARVS